MRGVPALNCVTSLVILRLSKVKMRSCKRRKQGILRITLVVRSTAILSCLAVLPFHIIFISNVRFYHHAFNVPMSDFEVVNSITEIHLTNTAIEVTWAFDVITIEHERDFTS